MNRKRIPFLLFIMSLLIISACDKTEDEKTMAIIIPGADHGFMAESIQHADSAAKRFADQTSYTFEVYTSANLAEQATQIDQVIAEKVNVVVLWPHHGDQMKPAAQKILDAKIPLIIYDRLISDFDETAEILGDNPTIGKEAGNYFNSYFYNELAAGEVCFLEFKGDSSSVTTQRTEGFRSTANPNFKLQQEFYTNWSSALARQQMETFLSTSTPSEIEKIQAVFTHDDEVAAGVLAAIEGYNGLLNISLVSGVSASRELFEKFDHYQAMGINQVTFSFSPAMIVDAMELGIDLLDGETVSGTYLIPTEVIDNSNYKAFMEGPVYQYRYFMIKYKPAATKIN